MKEILVVIALYGSVILIAAWADATEKKSCEVLLNEATLRANAVSDERVEKEKKIAELQTQLYIAQQRGIALQQQINDLKKPLEEKKAE